MFNPEEWNRNAARYEEEQKDREQVPEPPPRPKKESAPTGYSSTGTPGVFVKNGLTGRFYMDKNGVNHTSEAAARRANRK